MKIRTSFLFFSLLLFLISVPEAHSVNSVIAGGGSTDEIIVVPHTLGGNGTLDVVVFLEANKSYACTAIGSTSTDDIRFSTSVSNNSGTISNSLNRVALRGDVCPRPNGNISFGNTEVDNRIVITPVVADYYGFHLQNDSTTADKKVVVECMETSLYGGYNTNASPFNFLELLNTTNGTIAGTVRGFNYNGTQTVNTGFSIGPNLRYDIDIHTAAGPNKYGMLIVTHDGPYGALQGFVSQYISSSGQLQLQATVPLKPRDQTF